MREILIETNSFFFSSSQSLSDREQIDTTTQDCVVLSARLFAVNWDLTYEQRHLEGPPTIGHIDGSNDLQVGFSF